MDIDFITDLNEGFQISLTNNPRKVEGNRALLNRFELTFFTKRREFDFNSSIVQENYGGDAQKFIDRPVVLNDVQAISASVSIAIDQTVQSMKNDEPDNILNTEKIDRAELISLEVVGGIITATIQVYPVEEELYEDLRFNLPIIRGA